MGGKAIPNHPDYLTRVQAAREIAKALTGNPEHDLGHIAYRRIGEYQRSGKLPSEPIASGRTKQFHKKDLLSFASEVFDVEVDAFKMTQHPSNQDGDKQHKQTDEQNESPLLKDIKIILHLHGRQLLDPDKTISMIKQIVFNEVEEE